MMRVGLATTLRPVLLAACVLAATSGCGGLRPAVTVDHSTVPERPAPACDDQRDTLAPVALNRMSKAEYARTISDLIGEDVASALPALSGLVAGIPDDDVTAGFSNINWSLSGDHVTGYLGVANEVGVQIGLRGNLRARVLPCATDRERISSACVTSFVDTFATRAYRRPLTAEEKADLLGFFLDRQKDAPASALASLITRVLMSPSFLFKEEIGLAHGASTCAQRLDDDSFNLASRLAYGLWGRMPDAALFAAAREHELLDDAKLTAQIERMMRDDRTKAWVRKFFREWLRYDHLPTEGYAWNFLGKLDRAHLHDYGVAELDRFLDTIVWNDRGSFYDLMTSRKVITDSPSIRMIYGLPAERSAGEEEVPENRSGLLTRVIMLAQGSDEPSLVKRGAFIRRQILCDPLSPADPSLLPPGSLVPPEADYHLTTRQRWEARTAPAICQGCHRQINPFGFALEAYDGIGRFRKTERQLIPKSAPPAYTEFTIDTVVSPNVQGAADPPVDGPVALSAFIGQSVKGNSCFVKQLTKFVSRRPLTDDDLGDIRSLTESLMRPGGSIQGVLAGVVKNLARANHAKS
jgi:hypothetical protein